MAKAASRKSGVKRPVTLMRAGYATQEQWEHAVATAREAGRDIVIIESNLPFDSHVLWADMPRGVRSAPVQTDITGLITSS